MKNIVDIDSNFKIESSIGKDDVKFYDVKKSPFKLYGVFFEDGKFRRIPSKVAETVNEGVKILHSNTAGGRVRFKTDSPYVAIHAKMPLIGKMPHFALTGSAGFDMYVREEEGERYTAAFVPPFNIGDGYESVIELGACEMREITINFPLYSDVSELYIGLCESAEVLSPDPYDIENPIVFYGSSITQGGCASRPGNSYESMISRRFNCNCLNLGFSGNAKGEKEIAEYIKGLRMSVFVYDYDHNAPSPEYLENTHERMFRIIRDANPSLPIVMMSRPRYYVTDDVAKRLSVIKKTYDNAVKNGDKNVYLIDGPTLMAIAGNDGTVDGVHPNDLGFYSMARALGDVLEKIEW